MTREPMESRPESDPGPAIRRALARRSRGSRILAWFVVFLALLAIGQAAILIPVLRELGSRDRPPAIVDVNLPERVVRVFTASGDLRLILKSPLDLPEADRERAAMLDEALFPGGERHHYFVLHAVNPGDRERVVELADSPVVVEDSKGRTWNPVDLGAAIRSRAAELPAYLRFYLGVRVPANGHLRLPPAGARDVLLAYPADLVPGEVARARFSGLMLTPETLTKDQLDDILATDGEKRR